MVYAAAVRTYGGRGGRNMDELDDHQDPEDRREIEGDEEIGLLPPGGCGETSACGT